MHGFIKLFRTLLEHPIWKSKEKFCRRAAWVDLLLLANWKDSEAMLGNEAIIIHRGEIGLSQAYLAERWGWSRKRVCFFLKYLEKEKMIRLLVTSKGTSIVLENYTRFQDEGTGESTSKAHQKSRACTHIKNDKKDKKEKNIIQRENKEKDFLRVNHILFKGIKERIAQ